MATEKLKVSTGFPGVTENVLQSTQQRLKILWESHMHNPIGSVRHEKTHVLLLSWAPEDDDLDTGTEVRELGQTFEQVYGFHTYQTSLHGHKAPQQAMMDLSKFVFDHDEERSLLVIYYAGHGFADEKVQPGDIKLSGKSPKPNSGAEASEKASEIVWSTVEPAIMIAKNADVLLIFDCCNSGRLSRPMRGANLKTHYQLLSACSEDQTTHGPGDSSFTTALIWALKELAKENDHFTTSKLRSQIMKSPDFPKKQIPYLADRESRDTLGDLIICRKGLAPKPPRPHPTKSEREISEDRTYLDLRFVFENELKDDLLEQTADALKTLRDGPAGRKLDISRITFRSKFTATEHAVMRFKEAVSKKTATETSTPGSASQITNCVLNASGPASNETHSLLHGANRIEPVVETRLETHSVSPQVAKVVVNETTKEDAKAGELLSPSTGQLAPPSNVEGQKAVSFTTTVAEDTNSNANSNTAELSVAQNLKVIRRSLRQIVAAMLPGGKKKITRYTAMKDQALDDGNEQQARSSGAVA